MVACANCAVKSRRTGYCIGCGVFFLGMIVLIALLVLGAQKEVIQDALLNAQLLPHNDSQVTVDFKTNNKDINPDASGKPVLSCNYVFNITNPEELLAGGTKIKVKKVGPYCYDQMYERGSMEWFDDGDKFEYKKYSNNTFNEKESKGNKLTDIIYTPNFPYIIAQIQAQFTAAPRGAVGEVALAYAQSFFGLGTMWRSFKTANSLNDTTACQRWVASSQGTPFINPWNKLATTADAQFDAIEIANNTRVRATTTVAITEATCHQLFVNASTSVTSPARFSALGALHDKLMAVRANNSLYTDAEVKTEFATYQLQTANDAIALAEYLYRHRVGQERFIAQTGTPIKGYTWQEFADGPADFFLNNIFGLPPSELAQFPASTPRGRGLNPARRVGFFTGKKDHRKAWYIYKLAGRTSYTYPDGVHEVSGWANVGLYAFKRMNEETPDEPQNFRTKHWVDPLYQSIPLVNDQKALELHGLKLITMSAEKEYMSDGGKFWVGDGVKDVTAIEGLPFRTTPSNMWNVPASFAGNIEGLETPDESRDHYRVWIEPITGFPFKSQVPFILNFYFAPRNATHAQFVYSNPGFKQQPLVPFLDYESTFEADAEISALFSEAIGAYNGLIAADWLAVFIGVPIMLFGIFFCVVLTPKFVANYEMNN